MLRRTSRIALIAVALVSLLTVTGASVSGQARKPFEGVRIVVFGDAGHNLNPLEWYKDKIREEYGIVISDVAGVPFTNVYEKLKTEFVAETGAYDLVIFYPAYLGEFAGLGYLRPLDDFAAKYGPKLDDVSTGVRELNIKYGGKLYPLPYDGDVLNLYYRKDLFSHPTQVAAFRKPWRSVLQPRPERTDDIQGSS
ncbi:MAG: extracellular solute-binding protein [Firmicutes bacterium]|jgi:multiple sugar transport system substrate-binding protein|nr:extracellular solute-binding protein [Bacillota bacterium]